MADERKQRRAQRMPDTPWSLLGQAAALDEAALEHLYRIYQPVILKHLRLYRRLPPADAEDVTHGFFQDRVLRPGWLAKAERERGRFRAFLLTSLTNYLRDHVSALPAKRAGRIPVEALSKESVEETDTFEVLWAQRVMERALERAREACLAAGQASFWELFERRVVTPAMTGADAQSYADCLKQLGFVSVQQACNALVTVNRRLQKALREVVGGYVDADKVESEIRALAEFARRHDEVLAQLGQSEPLTAPRATKGR